MSLEIEGKLHKKFDAQQVSASFKKREFVVETSENYPQMVKFELVQDKCDLIDGYNEGEEIKVHFNVRGREWTSPKDEVKYFVSLNAWRLERMAATAGAEAATTSTPFPPEPEGGDNYQDDLPF